MGSQTMAMTEVIDKNRLGSSNQEQSTAKKSLAVLIDNHAVKSSDASVVLTEPSRNGGAINRGTVLAPLCRNCAEQRSYL